MRPPGPTLRVSGGDVMLGDLWLKPAQIDALVSHHAAAIGVARDEATFSHHTTWLRDLNRVVEERTRHRRAATARVREKCAPSPLAGEGVSEADG